MSGIHADMTLEEVAALVCDTLVRNGIPVVLSGGAVVSIYSDNEYQSFDLDFIQTGIARKVDPVMEELGFEKQKKRYWQHPDTRYWVEFPPGPVVVGEEVATAVEERRTNTGVLRLLPPTECVMDRLASYYHWQDAQCLVQAIAVARRHSVDLARIREWSSREGHDEQFEEFLSRLETRSS